MARKRKISPKFKKYIQAARLTKGKKCNRGSVMKAVKRGMSPAAAVKRHCA
jgi:hypothetical protein